MRRAVLAALVGACDAGCDQWEPRGRPLFWMHAPKTGTTFRLHLSDYACPRSRQPGANELVFSSRQVRLKVEEGKCERAFDETSFREHVSYRPEFCGTALAFLREPRRRLLSAFHFRPGGGVNRPARGSLVGGGRLQEGPKPCYLMGVPHHHDCARIRALPEGDGLVEYARIRSAQNVQTKMILGFGRYDDVAEKRLNASEAKRRLRDCFPFVGLTDMWAESLELFNRTFRGAAVRGAGLRTNVGTYDAAAVSRLDDYSDADTRLYRAAEKLFDARLAKARADCESN